MWDMSVELRTFVRLAAGILVGLTAPPCLAQGSGAASGQGAWPAKPIRFIAPFPPGGSSDVLCRLLGQKLTEGLGQPVTVDNRPGAGGNIGHEAAAKSPGDGYTLLLSSSSTLATNPHLYKRLGFDPLADLVPVTLIATAGQVLVVHPSIAAKNVSELVALARAYPGKLNFGSGGMGNQAHISAEMFKAQAGIDIAHIPYKGTGQAVAALVAGEVQMVFADMVPATPPIRSGRVRALAVTTGKRASTLPEVPTMIESGLPNYNAELWWAVMAPRGTPAEIINRLNAELARIIKLPDVQEKYAGLGIASAHSTPQRVTEMIRTRTQEMAKVLKAAGVVPE